MIATKVIQPSKLRVAGPDILWFGGTLVFPAVYVLSIHTANHIGVLPKLFFAACAIASGTFALKAARDILRIFKAPGEWKATIDADRVTWETAIPCIGFPLSEALQDIAKAIHLETRTTFVDNDGEGSRYEATFELHMKDGRILPLSQQTAGINPNRVFKALSQRGVRYEFWLQDKRKSSADTSKRFQHTY